ncbi:immunoglobulin-like domain-containing protein, partial [Enterovibrio norvegicus]|uniref:immunoglobulin-like domain-containing protein n=1 Tax=Enterovibrio norvegicus TaxID=188144 RepID=UPI001136A0A5
MDSIITKQPATVISVNGNVHVKVNGKDVHLSELTDITLGTEIIVPEGADALLALEDGSVLPIGVTETDELSLDSFSQDAEIAALQALLLNENFDPTQELEATAAGGSTSNTGSQTPTTISRAASETLAKAGYDTEGVSREFNTVRVERGDTTDTRLASGNDGSAPTEPLTPSVPTPTIDATFTLSSDTNGKDIVEGGEITYIVTLNEQAQEDITITLSNGENITVLAGETVGQVTVSTREDDLYRDDDKALTVTIDNISENSFDRSTPEGTVTNQVVDDSDVTTITLSANTANGTVIEGGKITYIVTLSAEANEDITVTLSNQQTITIKAGELSGSVDASVRDDDHYTQDDQTINVTIDNVSNNTFESTLLVGNVTHTVIDDSDTTTFTLSSLTNGQDITEGGTITYTVTLNAPTNEDITVTLSNAENITIKAGESEGSVTVDVRTDDLYQQADQALTVNIDNVSSNSFEDVRLQGSVKNTVVDDNDITTATLSSATNGQDITEGGTITYTVTLNAPTNEDITVTLSNAETITIKAGESEGSVTVDVRADDLYQQVDQALTVNIDNVSSNSFEDVRLQGSVKNTVVDDSDTVTVKLTASGSVNEGDEITYTATLVGGEAQNDITVKLANGETITISAGQTSGTVTTDVANDIYTSNNITNSIASVQESGDNAKLEDLQSDGKAVTTDVADIVENGDAA